VYNSCEALKGYHSQESDAYSLGLTLLAVFEGQDPFLQMKVLHGIDKIEFVTQLSRLIRADMGPKLCESRLFKTLKTIEGGKFKPVYSCLNEIFEGLTKVDIDERMSVHEACEKVQSIKPLLPKIGEGWECPSIDDIVKAQLAKYGGYRGYIVEKESESIKESDGTVLSTSIPSERQSERESKTPSIDDINMVQKQKHYGYSGTIIGGPMSYSEIQETTINPHDIIYDKEHYESEKESEESERDKEYETPSMASKLQTTEKDIRDTPSHMSHPIYGHDIAALSQDKYPHVEDSSTSNVSPYFEKDHDESEKSDDPMKYIHDSDSSSHSKWQSEISKREFLYYSYSSSEKTKKDLFIPHHSESIDSPVFTNAIGTVPVDCLKSNSSHHLTYDEIYSASSNSSSIPSELAPISISSTSISSRSVEHRNPISLSPRGFEKEKEE
ncbi:hypothetical protein ADUPG1_009916, partial [Aduncisulcus paluster]